jgi:hypothetical protein
MLPTWTYVKDQDGIYVNMFVGSTIRVDDVAGTDVEMVQQTDYPWDGHVAIIVNPASEAEFAVRIRSPQRSVSGLYSSTPEADGIKSILVNGSPVTPEIENGYVVIRRKRLGSELGAHHRVAARSVGWRGGDQGPIRRWRAARGGAEFRPEQSPGQLQRQRERRPHRAATAAWPVDRVDQRSVRRPWPPAKVCWESHDRGLDPNSRTKPDSLRLRRNTVIEKRSLFEIVNLTVLPVGAGLCVVAITQLRNSRPTPNSAFNSANAESIVSATGAASRVDNAESSNVNG